MTPQTEMQEHNNLSLTKPFEWRDQHGNFHKITEMKTKHLFFTIRMIWNHSAEKHHRIEPYKRYRFPDFYTREYIKQAVSAMSRELNNRDDLTPYFIKCLRHISDCLEKRRCLSGSN